MDIRLHYSEKGMGEPLILLHGNGEDGSYFKHQAEAFSADYRVIRPDTRGHGQSPRGTAPFCIRQFAEDLRCFMDDMGIEKAHILGFSDGGNIALCFALKYPERVISLVLNGANLRPDGVHRRYQLPIEIGYSIARRFPKARKNAEMLGLMVNDPFIDEAELERINLPVLVIAGTKDMIKESHTRRIAQLIKGAKLCLVEGDHFIAAKQPAAFNAVVKSFLEEVRNEA